MGFICSVFVPRDEIDRVTGYALERDYRRLAVLAPDSLYGVAGD